MNGIITHLCKITKDLNRLDTPWALIGGMALSCYVGPRTTKDFDIAVCISPDQDEQYAQALIPYGYRDMQILMHAMPVFKLGFRLLLDVPPSAPIMIDLLHSSSGIEHDITALATIMEILPGVKLPVAQLGHLIAMKELAQNEDDRLQDKVDLFHLIQRANADDIELAKAALQQISAKGKNRDKNLLQDFETHLNTMRSS